MHNSFWVLTMILIIIFSWVALVEREGDMLPYFLGLSFRPNLITVFWGHSADKIKRLLL